MTDIISTSLCFLIYFVICTDALARSGPMIQGVHLHLSWSRNIFHICLFLTPYVRTRAIFSEYSLIFLYNLNHQQAWMFYHLHTVVPMLRTNMRKSPQHRELSILASGISLPHLTLLASPTAQSLMKFDRETAKRGWWFSETNDWLSLLRFWAPTSSYPQSLALIIMGFEIKKQNAICINPKGSAKSMNCSSMSNFRARWQGGGGL